MKPLAATLSKWAALGTGVILTAILGFSCGASTSSAPPAPLAGFPQTEQTLSNTICGAPIFSIGRPIALTELVQSRDEAYELREIHFRDVIARAPNDIELAFRVEMRMQLSDERFLLPVHSLVCNEQNRPSRRAQRLSRTMIPVLGDLHLPSTRITVFDEATSQSDLYNSPRISEITVSNGGYFSFNQNWAPYRQIRTLSQYLNLLRTRGLYSRVELREMGEGWLGIYAEKNLGGETAQLMILLTRKN